MNSTTNNEKRFYIQTLGCKVNQYESQAMREILLKAGFKECLAKEIADIYIVNTCTVTHHADRESRYLIGLFHRTNTKAKIIVTGCYVENDADNVSFLPGVSHILKNDEKGRIAEVLGESHAQIQDSLLKTSDSLSMSITDFKDHSKAFVKVQDGCENYCSYCKIPLVRGGLKSKPLNNILKEVRILVEKGFREIILTGICLGAWGKDLSASIIAREVGLNGFSLVDVLKALNEIDGDFRIRLSSIEPKYVSDELVGFISENKRICPHLHIPLQSGDDEVLKKMNRPYTVNEYKTLLEITRSRINNIAITTDVLVGFPGESDINFKNTVNFIKEILPARTHIFTFSKRYGTAAYNMEGEVKNNILKKRYHELNTAALGASYLYRARFLNDKLDVLVETKRDKHSGLLTGYSDNYIKVLFEGPDALMKNVVPVRIEDINLARTLGVYEG